MWDNLRGFQLCNAYLPKMVWYGDGRGINATYELLKKKKEFCVKAFSSKLYKSHYHVPEAQGIN